LNSILLPVGRGVFQAGDWESFLDTLYIGRRIVGQDLSNKLCCLDKIRQLAYAEYSDNFREAKREPFSGEVREKFQNLDN